MVKSFKKNGGPFILNGKFIHLSFFHLSIYPDRFDLTDTGSEIRTPRELN